MITLYYTCSFQYRISYILLRFQFDIAFSSTTFVHHTYFKDLGFPGMQINTYDECIRVCLNQETTSLLIYIKPTKHTQKTQNRPVFQTQNAPQAWNKTP